ncbi:MAG: response regulator [Ignavibacteriales bacterium]|nr:response regulator [Ignavibacteriales bacterium]
MAEKHSHIETKATVAETLKRVDKLVKSGELEQALLEIERAKTLDPWNMYVSAYEDRIKLLQHDAERNRLQEEARRISEEVAEQKRKIELARQAEDARKRLKEDHDRRLEMEARKEESTKSREHVPALQDYNKELLEAWEDGAVTPEEERILLARRTSWNISQEEHFTLQAGVRRECYKNAFRKLWSSGSLTPESASTLAELRRKFNISAEEYEIIESELLQELRAPQSSLARLAIIDDDRKLLESLRMTLEEEGFEVHAFDTSDGAYEYLRDHSVDLILSDINLETSTMGGFAFYQKLRELGHLNRIPFLFLSGLTDEAIICAGKELGADDYVTKPFDLDTLVAIMKGKLRRYKALSKVHHN